MKRYQLITRFNSTLLIIVYLKGWFLLHDRPKNSQWKGYFNLHLCRENAFQNFQKLSKAGEILRFHQPQNSVNTIVRQKVEITNFLMQRSEIFYCACVITNFVYCLMEISLKSLVNKFPHSSLLVRISSISG